MTLIEKIKWHVTWRLSKVKPKMRRLVERYKHNIREYQPGIPGNPQGLPDIDSSAWKGLEFIVEDIIKKSRIETKRCLEFGVELGFSTAAFANYFDAVIGIDTFDGDIHAGFKPGMLAMATHNLREFDNVTLVKSDYRDFIDGHNERYDLIHVDIIHTYEATYDCGLWAATHSSCTLFHDTESYPEVKKAVIDICKKTKKRFYNYPYCKGLGIVY